MSETARPDYATATSQDSASENAAKIFGFNALAHSTISIFANLVTLPFQGSSQHSGNARQPGS